MEVKFGKPQWRKGFSPGVEASVAHQEFEAIRAASDLDHVEPAAVVERAKDKANPLHGCFEWDNRKAGNAWRVHQARNLVNKLEVVVEVGKQAQTVKAYEVVTVPRAESEPRRSYQTIESIMQDPDARLALVTRLLRQLVALRSRHRACQELAVVWRAIDEAATELEV